MKIQKLLVLALLGLFLISCNKDEENPTIFVSTPANHSDYNWEDLINVTASFADDKGLASYEVKIGDEDGGHVHNFHYEKEGDIEGTAYNFADIITVPDSIDDVYWLHFIVEDAEGKETTEKVMLHFSE